MIGASWRCSVLSEGTSILNHILRRRKHRSATGSKRGVSLLGFAIPFTGIVILWGVETVPLVGLLRQIRCRIELAHSVPSAIGNELRASIARGLCNIMTFC